MNITKGKFKKLLRKGNKKQTNKIKKKVHFRRKKTNNRSLKKGGTRVNLRVKTLKYGGVNKKKKRKIIEENERKSLILAAEKKKNTEKNPLNNSATSKQKQASINFAKREEAKRQAKLTATSTATKPVASTVKQVTPAKTEVDKLINDNIVDLKKQQPKITKFNNTTSNTQAKQVTPANPITTSPPTTANTQGPLLRNPSMVEPQPPPKLSTGQKTNSFANFNSNSSGANPPPPPASANSTSSGPTTKAFQNRKKQRALKSDDVKPVDVKPLDRPANTQGSLLRKPSMVEPQPPPKSSTEQKTNPFLNINSNSSGTNSPPPPTTANTQGSLLRKPSMVEPRPPPSPQQNIIEDIKQKEKDKIYTRADEKIGLLQPSSNSSGKKSPPSPPPLPTSPASPGSPLPQGPVTRAIANSPPEGPPVSFSRDRDLKKPQSNGKMEYNVRISIGEDGAVTTNVRGPTGGDFDGNLQKYVGEQFGGKKTNKKNKKTNKKHKKTNKKT